MPRNVKNFFGCLVTLVLVVLMIPYLGQLVRPVETDDSVQAIRTFHSLPEDSLEVIGYGSSHMWHGLDTMTMYENYGIGAYNYGCNWQRINTTSLFIQDSLRTQSPKVILVETFNVNALLEDTDLNGEIYYTREIPDFEGKREYLKQCFGEDLERYLSYWIPLSAFHGNWVNLSQESFQGVPDDDRFLETMGYLKIEAVEPVQVGDPDTFPQEPLSESAVAVLDEIVALCREKGVEIVFYTAPYALEYPYADAMTEYAREHDCAYLDLFQAMEEIGIDCQKDFRDFGHLNYTGSVKVADYLGRYLADHYDLTDMRTVENCLWKQYS